MNIEQTDNFIASLGFEAYRVGGSVRDEIIGRVPKDADYMIRGVSLIDLEVQLRINAMHDRPKITDLVLRDGQHVGFRVGRPYDIEITLPRREESTGPGHGDFKIVVDPEISLEEDAQRRDFTFNALYKVVSHPENLQTSQVMSDGTAISDIIDPTARGIDDLQRRLISVTHFESFRDDPLRILRALRFVARGYELASTTRYLMGEHADSITGLTSNGHMSGTVYDEMSNILMGTEVATALRIARDTGVLGTLFPVLKPMLGFDQGSRYHDLTTDEHTFTALESAARVGAPLEVRWALLFRGTRDHEVEGEAIWLRAAEAMGVDKATRDYVAALIRHHMLPVEGKFKASKVRLLRVEHGDRLLRDLIRHRACDIRGKGKPDADKLMRLLKMEQARSDAEYLRVPASVGDLQINGRDAIEAGLKGADIGKALHSVLRDVAAQPSKLALTREWQLEAMERWAASS